MAKASVNKTRQTFSELSTFLSRPDLIDALERAANDRALLRQAKANPRAFLRAQGINVPPRTDLEVLQRRATVSGRITICVRICRRFGPIQACADICITVVFQT
jgi:hypothetical protein